MHHLLLIFSNICFIVAINLATALIADECAELNVDGRDALGRTNDAAGSGLNLFPDVKVATSGRVKSLNFFTYNTGYAYVSFWKPLGNEQFELVTKVQVNSSQRHNLEHFVPDQHYYVEEGNVVAVHFEGGGAPWNGLIAYESNNKGSRTDGVTIHRVYSETFTDDGWMPGYDVGTNEIGQIESYRKSAALQIEICNDCEEINVDGRATLGPTNSVAGPGFNLFPDVQVPRSGRVKSLTFYTYNTGYAYVSFWKPLGNHTFQLVAKIEVYSSQSGYLQYFVPEQQYYVEEGNVVAVHFANNGNGTWNGLIAYEINEHDRTPGVTLHRVYQSGSLDNGWLVGYIINSSSIGTPANYTKSAALQIDVCDCDEGTYGTTCSKNCSDNCKNGVFCHHVTGACDHGCIPGYYAPMCTESCENGWHGDNCTSECGSCLNNEPCNSTNGFCGNGCADGFYETGSNTCMQECNTGTYGRNCSHNCSDKCNNGTYCHHITGACDFGCIWGYYAPMCIEGCYSGWYGDNCTSRCGGCRNNEPCTITNGYCESGCANGYHQTDYCTESCFSGTYGHNCMERCSENCLNNLTCDIADGACTSGCNAGYDYDESPQCNTPCGYERFGASCGSKCYCSDSTTCDTTTGTCPQGCTSGYMGATCSTRKQKQDSNAASSDVTGWIVAVAILTVLVVVLAVTLTLTCARSWNAVRASLDKTLPAVTTADIQDIILEPVPENIQHQNGRATDSDYETIHGLTTQTPTPVKYETLQIYQNP